MSQTFKASQIIRCPFCVTAAQPQRLGYGCLLCECCGQQFRVVHATPGKTGKRLSQKLRESIEWK
jgi:ribosomal protein L37AE/L43A